MNSRGTRMTRIRTDQTKSISSDLRKSALIRVIRVPWLFCPISSLATLTLRPFPGPDAVSADRLQHAIDHAAHLLPAQGPITVFIHHNTLHAFEDLPFDQAVARGARAFGCQPYLSEERYRAKLARGRIRTEDLDAVLRADLGGRGDEAVPPAGTRLELRPAMLRRPTRR